MTDEKKPPQEVAAIKLCAGVNVMADRLCVAIYAFAPDAPAPECKISMVLWGDPLQADVWQGLQMLIGGLLRLDGDVFANLTAVAIDSGGYHAQQVYRFVYQCGIATAGGPVVLATKSRSTKCRGQGPASALVDVCCQGKTERLELFFVDVSADEDGDDVTLAGLARLAFDRAALAA